MVDIRYDKLKNRVIVADGQIEIELYPPEIRNVLPMLTEKEKVEDLEMMMHEIDREKLTKALEYNLKMLNLVDDLEKTRRELENCKTATCIKQWQAIGKIILDKKNCLAEIRRTIGWLGREREKVEFRRAKLIAGEVEK